MLEIIISKNASSLIKQGFPWVYKKDIINRNSALEISDPGELCYILDEKGKRSAIGYFNKNTNIAARVLSQNPKQMINEEFFREKFSRSIARRKKHFKHNYFRAVYGESDGFPGLIIDMFGEYAVAQINSAGMDKLQEYWFPALLEVMRVENRELRGVYLDPSSKSRIREGLDDKAKVIYGDIPKEIEIKENGIVYYADIVEGQKTGWFYDHRDNRKYLSMLAGSRKVLDLYAHSGGFGLLCAAHDAAEVVMVDRSQLALNLAEKAAYANNLTRYAIIRADIFQYLDDKNNEMPKLSRDMGFDMVNADPPAFIKTRDDIAAGLKGYEKLVKKCLPLVNEGGIFAISSCSSFARPEQFQKVIDRTLAASGREFSLLRRSGADKDHPIHPMLGETNYLKFLAYQLD